MVFSIGLLNKKAPKQAQGLDLELSCLSIMQENKKDTLIEKKGYQNSAHGVKGALFFPY